MVPILPFHKFKKAEISEKSEFRSFCLFFPRIASIWKFTNRSRQDSWDNGGNFYALGAEKFVQFRRDYLLKLSGPWAWDVPSHQIWFFTFSLSPLPLVANRKRGISSLSRIEFLIASLFSCSGLFSWYSKSSTSIIRAHFLSWLLYIIKSTEAQLLTKSASRVSSLLVSLIILHNMACSAIS